MRGVDLLRRDDGARADDQVAPGRQGRQYPGRLGRPEGDLGYRQAAGHQGRAEVVCTVGVPEDDDRHDPVRTQDVNGAHRSSAMTVLSSV